MLSKGRISLLLIEICFVFRARAKPLPCFSPVTSGLAICLSDQLIW